MKRVSEWDLTQWEPSEPLHREPLVRNLFNSPTWKTPLTGDHSSIWNCSNTDDDGDDNSQNDDDDVKGDSDDIDDGHDNDDGDDKAGRGIKLKWVSIFHTVVAMMVAQFKMTIMMIDNMIKMATKVVGRGKLVKSH